MTGFSEIPGDDPLRAAWDSAQPAEEFKPLPPGKYVCRIIKGELRENRNGTPEYVLTFRVLEGDHSDRQIWLSLYLTENALSYTKRDLAKIGITSPDQLEEPVPEGIRCSVIVQIRCDDDGKEWNRIKSFEFLGIDPPEVDPFAPPSVPDSASVKEESA